MPTLRTFGYLIFSPELLFQAEDAVYETVIALSGWFSPL